jgi:hypothetical protein
MKVGLDKGYHAHMDIHRGVCRRRFLRSANIVEDPHINAAIETGTPPTRSVG